MDKVQTYRRLVMQVLQEKASIVPAISGVERQLLFDLERDHYQLMVVGWHNDDRYYHCSVHIDIKDAQIWIQHDVTEDGITAELVNLGVPKEAIVLAFHAPYKRPYTGYAVGGMTDQSLDEIAIALTAEASSNGLTDEKLQELLKDE
ncbi:MAG: XisI protein [Gammaproteobacteria bacterium]|nr:XisI protein [Gammaproteobacteria bacterium]MBU1724013.1 XisI protein [Gammaproteobacteria bacterium]MBU2006918.1 XisI protein [Gammaproteobacteria bacterium]